ncbi:MAG TPA: AarF/UbiB family protein [Thermoanaerobaculia bacterium]|nr:AarF/UbiB family protein [Thermoanaerobaculia bacterium]
MSYVLAPDQLRRYRDIVRLLAKYGRSDLVDRSDLEPILSEEPLSAEAAADADELTSDLEALGPTFIKLGQLLSTRSDLLPPAYLESLARLQDHVEPFPYAEVEAIIHEELGVRVSKAFAELDSTPLASASLGQVHRARLRDGRLVAVKVQRPGIRQRIAGDLEALERIADFLDGHTEAGRRFGFADILDQFRKSLVAELDYRREAQNLLAVGASLESFELLVVPQPVADYTTSRVLTMDFLAGARLDELSPLVRMDYDGAALAEQLFAAYLRQILVDGLFHADPHPGNLLLTRDGRIALLDLGMVGHVSPGLQEQLLKLLLALSEGRGEEVAHLVLTLGSRTSEVGEPERFRRDIADLVMRHREAALAEIELGRVVLELVRVSGGNGVRVPAELTLLGKALLNLDHVGRALDPTFNPNAAIRRHAAELMSRRLRASLSPGNVLSGLIEAKEFAEALPGRVNAILTHLAENDLRLKVDAFDERELIRAFQKIANRITTGLVLAALVVGAALMMRVETAFTLFGYPGFAMLCFLAAAAGAVFVLWDILIHDRGAKPHR